MKFMNAEEASLWMTIYTKAFEQNYPEPEEEADKIKTVADVVNYVQAKKAAE